MSLKKYLLQCGIDNIREDQMFMEEEYNAVQTYCEVCGYVLSADDLSEIKSRGLEDSIMDCKTVYTQDLWDNFYEVPINQKTETIAKPWRNFPAGTHRSVILQWFEETFNLSVLRDLMTPEQKLLEYQKIGTIEECRKAVNVRCKTTEIVNRQLIAGKSNYKEIQNHFYEIVKVIQDNY